MFRSYFFAFIIILLDQFTKWVVSKRMENRESIPVIENVFHITSHRNAGAAFGILQGHLWLFVLITLIVVGVSIFYLHRTMHKNPIMAWGLTLVLGGAIGNFIDRILFGEVVDFLDVYIFTYNFPIFNIADIALTLAFLLVLVAIYKDEKQRSE
ncbi:signal peptidase II [Shouchella shacheensis]|uniref:signal peptidase II n=1 Tax=Shouchella shacheensis TaxID=1649580 RepID=UPI0007400F8A|nr:signal peptidase II [Shouchella shacheensis]